MAGRDRLLVGLSLFACVAADRAMAQGQPSPTLDSVIVTARKRTEALEQLPVSASVVSRRELERHAVTQVSDLVRIIPGFQAADSGYGTPVYFLRGVGFYDSSVAARPAVGVYIDEAPLPYAVLTRSVGFDIERVEVLKGPQSALFGQNTTGGAIHYVSARPTPDVQAGARVSLASFSRVEAEGFASGPLGDSVQARLAVRREAGGAWQRSLTRDEALGDRDLLQGRATLTWAPAAAARFDLTVAGSQDRSDTQAAQFLAPFQQTAGGFFDPRLAATPPSPRDSRAADWGPGLPLSRDDRSGHARLRFEGDLGRNVTITTLTAYARLRERYGQEGDGTPLRISDFAIRGDVRSVFQEVRLTGPLPAMGSWLVGVTIDHGRTSEQVRQRVGDLSTAHVFDRLGLPPIDEVPQVADTEFTSRALFVDLSAPLAAALSVSAAARYTDADLTTDACVLSAGNGTYGQGLERLLALPAGSIPLGGCATLGADRRPTRFHGRLPEDNFSWRLAGQWTPEVGTAWYASVSRGFKAGSFANLAGSDVAQYRAVTQERLTAYEIGARWSAADGALRVDGAVFHYDYRDKQLKGRTIVPIFGPLEALVNVPRSRVRGAEAHAIWAPVEALRFEAGATWLDTRVTRTFNNYTAFGQPADFEGARFPYTPRWQVNGTVDYRAPLSSGMEMFAGVAFTYRGATQGDFLRDPRLAIDSYTLLDLRAGLASAGGGWEVFVFGRNVTDADYWHTATRRADAVVRYTGAPATYGLSLSYAWR